MNIQKNLVLRDARSKEEIENVIKTMKNDNSNIINAALQKELTELYDSFEGMTEMLQNNFE
jgi:molecular chaperone GrpE (heat shock protein)